MSEETVVTLDDSPSVRPFRRRLLGYRRSEVDRTLDLSRRQLAALRAEVAELRAADPFALIGADVSGMLRALAEAVAVSQERAERRADEVVAEARAEADHIRAEAEAFAESVIDGMLVAVEPQLHDANEARRRLAAALTDAQDALAVAVAAVDGSAELYLDLTVPEGVAVVAANGSAPRTIGSTPDAPLSVAS